MTTASPSEHEEHVIAILQHYGWLNVLDAKTDLLQSAFAPEECSEDLETKRRLSIVSILPSAIHIDTKS